MQYSKAQINSNILKALEAGRSNDDALDLFLKMNMENDLSNERPFIRQGPSPSDVYGNLIGNHDIDKDDIRLELVKGIKTPTERLVVKLSPICVLYAEKSYASLQVTINDKNMTSIYLKSYRADDIALWIIRQKQHLEKYMQGWDAVLSKACKKAKSNRLAYLAIRAIFTDAMKDYPRLKYVIVEQRQRAKIKVMIPHTHLGVYLYAWWGSYKKQLPQQIESLKKILEVHSKSCLTNFFIYR